MPHSVDLADRSIAAVEGETSASNRNAVENLTSVEGEVTPSNRNNLTSLPTELIERILCYLLSAKEVKKPRPAPQAYLTHYDFSTNILRVNKQLHDIGATIFHANSFILLSTNTQELLQHAANNLLPIWQSRLAKFKGHHLRLNILHRITPRGEYVFALILAADLAPLVDSVRMRFLAVDAQCEQYRWPYSWNFEVRLRVNGTRLPLPAQRALLEPFKKIRYRGQRCVVRGEVDPEISAELQSVMSPSVFWRRADEVGALYELFLRRLLKMGELMWSHQWLAAYLLMRDLDTFLDACDTFSEDAGRGDDATLMKAFRDMCYRLFYNKLLVELYLAITYWYQIDMHPLLRRLLNDATMRSRDALPLCIPTIEVVCATCHFMLNEHDLCWERVDKCYEADRAGL